MPFRVTVAGIDIGTSGSNDSKSFGFIYFTIVAVWLNSSPSLLGNTTHLSLSESLNLEKVRFDT